MTTISFEVFIFYQMPNANQGGNLKISKIPKTDKFYSDRNRWIIRDSFSYDPNCNHIDSEYSYDYFGSFDKVIQNINKFNDLIANRYPSIIPMVSVHFKNRIHAYSEQYLSKLQKLYPENSN